MFIAAQIMGPHSSASCPVPNGWNLLTDMCRGGGLFQLDLEGTSSQRRSFYNSGSAPQRLVEEWPAALGFGSLITNFPLTDAQFSCRKVRTLPPEEQPSALAAGSYKKYHTLLPPCVLSRLGRQSGFFPRKAACLAGHTALQGGGKGSLCRDAREQNSPLRNARRGCGSIRAA